MFNVSLTKRSSNFTCTKMGNHIALSLPGSVWPLAPQLLLLVVLVVLAACTSTLTSCSCSSVTITLHFLHCNSHQGVFTLSECRSVLCRSPTVGLGPVWVSDESKIDK